VRSLIFCNQQLLAINRRLTVQCVRKKIENSKGVIASSKSKRDEQYYDPKKEDRKTNNGSYNTTQKLNLTMSVPGEGYYRNGSCELN